MNANGFAGKSALVTGAAHAPIGGVESTCNKTLRTETGIRSELASSKHL